MNKYRCYKCKLVWFSVELESCPNSDDNDKTHKVKQIKAITSEDYADMWASDLESENRHSLTSMPNDVLSVLEKYVKDEKVINKIMKDMYSSGIGL